MLGVNVTTIVAVDRDGQELTYSFFSNDPDDDSSYFDIDSTTGVITVKKNLDRELQGEYEVSMCPAHYTSIQWVLTALEQKVFLIVRDADATTSGVASCRC